ncbi:reverse transcriptase domain-containing protein [Tanacetum coccineum]
MIDQGVNKSTNGDDSHVLGTCVRRTDRVDRECTYPDFMKCQPLNFKGTEGVVELIQWFEKMETVTIGYDVVYVMTWTDLKKKMTDKYCSRVEIKKLEAELWNLKVKEFDKIKRYVSGLPDMIHGSVVALKPKTMQEAIEIATELMDKKICTFPESKGHFKRDCPKLKNNNRGNQATNVNAPAKVYAVGRPGTNPDSNVMTGTFLLNNRYASMLFDTGADRSFVSTTFSSQIDITPTALDYYYDVELVDEIIIRLKTILRGCTLNFLNHPFNIDLMPVELSSFDAIIVMDWLAKYQAIIVCTEKIIRIP